MKFSKFFSRLQEAPWYRLFLNPVINETGASGTLLDIGTGSGKLIQILTTEKQLKCTGIDTDANMLAAAKIKLAATEATLIEIEANKTLPFENNSFDYITICSVLFHLQRQDIEAMLRDTLRLLKAEGKIIILTPTGRGSILKLSKHYLSLKNQSIYIWYQATKKRAQQWTRKNYLAEYAFTHNLHYKRAIVMNGFAQLEIIQA